MNMTIQELKKELGLTNSDIAGFFGLSPMAYANSSAKSRYETAILNFYAFVKSKAKTRYGIFKRSSLFVFSFIDFAPSLCS